MHASVVFDGSFSLYVHVVLFCVVPALQGISFAIGSRFLFLLLCTSHYFLSRNSIRFSSCIFLFFSIFFVSSSPIPSSFIASCVFTAFVCFGLDLKVQVEKGRSGNIPIYPNQEGTIASFTTSLIALVSWPQPTSLALAKGRRTSDNRTSPKPYSYLFCPAQSHLGLAFTSLLTHLTHPPSGLVIRPLPLVIS